MFASLRAAAAGQRGFIDFTSRDSLSVPVSLGVCVCRVLDVISESAVLAVRC